MNQMFEVATGALKIEDTKGWWYRIVPLNADSSFNYEVFVYLDGGKKGSTYADTKWGARKAARTIRRNFYKRALMTPETGPLK